MNPQDKTKVGHPARVDVKSIDQIAMEFETAWRESLEGGPRPDVASFLKSHADIDQESLREQLEKINLEFQQRTTGHQSEALAPTLAIGVQASERDDSKTVEPTPTEAIEPGQEPRLDPTILLAPGVSPGLDATMDLGPQAAAEQEPTIQFGESQIGKAGGDSEEDGFRLQATMDLDGVQPDRDALDPTFPLGEAASFELGPRERKGEQVPRVRGYKILGVLGRGGMGVVYRALHVKLKRVVALKMVLAGSHAGPEQLDRFYSEAEAVAHLQHPNIIQIYEVAEQDGLPYFSLEYVDGGSLVQKCAGKPLADQEAARLVELLARAMHYAHRHDVVHRDLKPANILLTADGVPKVTDFGLAKRLEEGSPSQTRSGAILGTPSYMAPEQALGEVHEIGPLTDVYSLGAILYELITGRPPFLAPNAMDTVMQVAQQDPVAPTQLQPQVSRDLETICLKCLQKEKGRRYASAEDLAEDLRRFQAGEPITARAVSGPERLWRWCRRNPKVAGLTATVAALLLIASTGSFIAAIVIRHERDAAVQARELAEANEKSAKREQARAETAEQVATEKEQLARNEQHRAEAAEKEAKQNEQLAKDNEKLANENAELAADQASIATDALKAVVSEIDSVLRDAPRMRQVRNKVLQIALEKADQVIASEETASTLDRSRAAALLQKAFIYRQLNQPAKAYENQMLAHEILLRLADSKPAGVDADKARGNLALSFDILGDLVFSRDPDTAQEYYERADGIRQDLFENHESDFYALHAREGFLADSLDKLARVAGNSAEARRLHEEALKLRLRSVETAPKHEFDQYLQYLATTHSSLGQLGQRTGDLGLAREHFEKSLELRVKFVQKDELNMTQRFLVAMTLRGLGDAELYAGNPEVAEQHYQASLNHIRRLVELDGGIDYQRYHSQALYRLGAAVLKTKDEAAAHSHFAESVAILKTNFAAAIPESPSLKTELMLSLARSGQHEEAANYAEEIGVALDPGKLFQAGCGFSLCISGVQHLKPKEKLTPEDTATQQRYADKAIDALSRAIDKGYKDLVALESDPDLEAVRVYPEFVHLTERLKSGAAAGGQP